MNQPTNKKVKNQEQGKEKKSRPIPTYAEMEVGKMGMKNKADEAAFFAKE
ncbi:hypothetical protein [Halalkalibacterium halodurans]|nr:hypothetical protein [Halalkalibacterium halodurans]